MAVPLRMEYAEALYHVTSRGDHREDVYLDDEYRAMRLDVSGSVCKRINWRCHARRLTDNRYRILMENVEGNGSGGKRQLNGAFAICSNRRYEHVRYVAQERCKAIFIQWEIYR